MKFLVFECSIIAVIILLFSPVNGHGLTHGGINYQIYRTLEYEKQYIHIYKSMSSDDADPTSWSFYYVPAMLPDFSINNQWIWVMNNETRVHLLFGNTDVTERVRDEICQRAGTKGKDKWSIKPLIIDSFTAYVVSDTNNIVAGVRPFYVVNPSSSSMVLKFQCSTNETAYDVMNKILHGDYQIEIMFNFAGWNQISTNMVSISSETIKRVISQTLVDGGNTNAQYIHRNQNNSFISSYLTSVKKTIYIENPYVDTTILTNGLDEDFQRLMREAMDTAKQTQLDAKLFEQLWSSSDFDPNVITSELNKIFIYNQTASEIESNSNIYFDYNEKHAQSSSTSGKIKIGFEGFGGTIKASHTQASEDQMGKTTHNIVSQKDINEYLAKQSIETVWNGKRLEPKSFNVYKLTDITDKLQVAIMTKQLFAEKANNATLITISTMNMPSTLLSHNESSASIHPELVLTGEIRMYSGTTPPSLPWLLCDGKAISRRQYPRLFSVIGENYGAGDRSTTFNLPDFRGRVPVGTDKLTLQVNNANRQGLVGGKSNHQLSVEQLPQHRHEKGTLGLSINGQHTHSYDDNGHTHKYGYYTLRDGNVNNYASSFGKQYYHLWDNWTSESAKVDIKIKDAGAHSHTITGETAAVGMGQQFSLMPPYLVVDYIIYSN